MMDDDHLKYKPNKLCGICGDKALGYNFNAITCEACKAFFRRNALRTKDFKCPFDGNCKIDLVTRRFCQKCRLKKCFDIGMKKEWILSEEEKRVKRDKIIENRRKKESTTSGHHNHHHHNHHHNHHRLMMMNGNTTTSNDDDGDDDDIIMSSITSQNSNHSDDNNSSSNHSFIVTNNDSMNNNNNKTLMNIPMGNGNVVTHNNNNHQNARAINLDFQENSHHHHHHRNNQKENFFNSFYRFDHHQQQQQQYKCQQNLYLSGRFFPQFSSRISENNNNNNDLYSTTTKFSNNIKPSSSSSLNQSYQPNNHYTLPPQSQYHHQYQHHYQQPPQPPQPLPQTQFHSSSSSSSLSYGGKSMINPITTRMSPTTTITTNNNNRPLSLTMKTNSFQGSSSSSSSSPSSSSPSSSALLCKNNNNNNNSSNNNHHRNIDPDRLNIKIEYNNDGDQHLIQTNHITTHSTIDVHQRRPSTIFSLKTEPDDYNNTISPLTTNSVKHIPASSPSSSSSIINVNNENIKRRCHSDCTTTNSISIVDRTSLFINHESESANIVFNVNHNDSKEISNFQSKIILKTENINKNDTSSLSSSTSTSPLNGKTSSTPVNVSFSLPDEKFTNFDNLMKNDNGQSSNGNTISIFQSNLSEMAPESISETYNYIENYRLEELTDACNQLNHWYHNGSILYEMRHLKEIYRVAEHVFQHFISMAKMITAFADLCETDQISLLKYSVTEILILRSVSCFMPNKDAWIFNLDNNEKGTMLQFNTCKSQIPEFSDDIRHFILAVPEKCRQDRNLFDLATMVVLFNPNCLDLKHKDVVKLEHITYCHLLCKYIHKNYSSTTTTTLTMEKTTEDAEKHSIIQFNTMLNLIDQLHKINQKINNNILPFHTIINEEYDKKHLTQA